MDRREGGQCRVNPKVIGRFSSTGCQWNCLVDKDTGHHEVCYDDEDNHRIVLVDALEVNDGIDYTSYVLGKFQLWRRSSLTLLFLVSFSASIFCSSFICFLVHVLLLWMSSWSCSCLVVVLSFNKLG